MLQCAFLLIILVFFCSINLTSCITAGNLIKTKNYLFIYKILFTYYEILIYWVLLAHLLLLHYYHLDITIMFFCFLFEYFKPNLFYRYFFETLQKQKLRATKYVSSQFDKHRNVNMTIFKKFKRAKKNLSLKKMMAHLINNTCCRLRSIK